MFVQLPGDNLLWREFQNAGHTFLFGAIAIAVLHVLYGVYPAVNRRPVLLYSMATLVSFIVASITESGQLLTQRDASLPDLARDMIGIITCLGLYSCIDPVAVSFWDKGQSILRTGVIVLCLLMLVASLLPFLRVSVAYSQRNEAYPRIIDFNADWSRHFIKLNHANLSQTTAPAGLGSGTNDKIARLTLNPAQYPGVTIIELYSDWSTFKTLVLDIFSTEPAAFELVLRVHDKKHNQEYSDRFNQRLLVVPGRNHFSIPLVAIQHAPKGREMDMQKIDGIILFAKELNTAVEFYPAKLSLK